MQKPFETTDSEQLTPHLLNLPLELGATISSFTNSKTMSSARIVSRNWKNFFSHDRFWEQKLCEVIQVNSELKTLIKQSTKSNTAFICYRQLKILARRKPNDGPMHYLINDVLQGNIEQNLLFDCLMDDITLLQKIPNNEMLIWLALSCFADCQNIPKAILQVYPINKSIMDEIIAASGNISIIDLILSPNFSPYLKPDHSTLGQVFSAVIKSRTPQQFIILFPYLLAKLQPYNNTYKEWDFWVDTVLRSAISTGKIPLIHMIIGYIMHIPYINSNKFHFTNIIKTPSGQLLFNEAVKQGNLNVVSNLHEFGFTYDHSPDQWTLHYAAKSSLSILRSLLEDFSLIPNRHTLLGAVMSGKTENVKFLTENHPHLIPDDTIINSAVASGNIELVKYLINLFPILVRVRLLEEAAASSCTDMVHFLEKDYNLKPPEPVLQEMFYRAANAGDLPMLKFLSKHYNRPFDGFVLRGAVESNNISLLKFLIDPKNNHQLPVTPGTLDELRKPENFFMANYAFHPETRLFPLANANRRFALSRAQQQLEQVFATFTTKKTALGLIDKNLLTIAATTDPESFYLTMDSILTEFPQNSETLKLEILRHSPIPTTQLCIAEHALSHPTSLNKEEIKILLSKAKSGLQLLSKLELAAKAEVLLAQLDQEKKIKCS